jgi:hypothetical protein
VRIAVKLAFDEEAAVRLLNWLARENAYLLRQRPELPLLYDSGVVYRRERDEVWCDYLNLLARGHEDCDALAAARAGELLARGWRAVVQGEPGFKAAQRLRPRSIRAEVFLRTRTRPGGVGLFHCVTRYRLGGRWRVDDPSARLGMYGGAVDPAVKQRWSVAGVTPQYRPSSTPPGF